MVSTRVKFVPCSGETWRDPWPMYAALRDHDPVHHVEDGDYWVLSRYDDVAAAALDTETFSSAQGLTFTYDDMAAAGLEEIRPMVFLDPPEHGEFRRLVVRGFTPRQVTSVEPEIRSFVADRVERLRQAGGGDVVAELLKPLPSLVVGRYLGVPASDQTQFDNWTNGIVAANALGDPLLASQTVTELFGYFDELIKWRRASPDDDVISELVQAADEASVSALQILGFAFTMVTGGNDTTTGLLSCGLDLLSDHPQQQDRLVDDPSLIPAGIEELLRLTSPVQGLARTTTRDVDIAGTRVPRGRKVFLLYGSANRDPREFGPTAEALDVGRRPARILTFSIGAHHCLGAAAARLMGRVVLEELLGRCPSFAVDGAAGEFAPGHFVRRFAALPFTA